MNIFILGMLISATQSLDSLTICDGQRVTVDVMVIPKENYKDFVTFGMESILDELAVKKGADGIIVIPEYDTAADLEDLPSEERNVVITANFANGVKILRLACINKQKGNKPQWQ